VLLGGILLERKGFCIDDVITSGRSPVTKGVAVTTSEIRHDHPMPSDPRLDDDMIASLYVRARRVASRIVGPQESPDVAAETVVRAVERWARISDHAMAWVTVVAANRAIDLVRRGVPAVAPPTPVSFDEEVIERLMVVELLRRLPQRQRQVLVLHYWVGLTDAEIAIALDLSVATVRTHAGRAMSALRQEIAGGSK
jgi:RNA polymerase sigma factor (sigma-70 family)